MMNWYFIAIPPQRHWRMCFERLLQAFARWQPGNLFNIAAQPVLEYRWIGSYSQLSLQTQFKVATVYLIHTQSLSLMRRGSHQSCGSHCRPYLAETRMRTGHPLHQSTRRRISWIFFKRRSPMSRPAPAGMPGRRRQIRPSHHPLDSKRYRMMTYEGSSWLPRQSHAHSIRHSSSRKFWCTASIPDARVVNETFRFETETRPRHSFYSPRRDQDQDLPTFLRDRDEIETVEFQPETRFW